MMVKCIKWIPSKAIPATFYKVSLVDRNGLTITFKDDVSDQKTVVVKFDGVVLSYRNTDEGSLGKLLYEIRGSLLSDWSLYRLENSDFIDWFLSQAGKIYDEKEIKHYLFITSDDVIEVLSTFEPEISIDGN